MDAPYLNCDGCRTSLGRAGCPIHRQNNAVTIAPSTQWSSSEPVLTHCRHGLDLRIHPRCYLCNPDNPDARLREAYLAGVRRGASDGMEGYPMVADDYLAALGEEPTP